MQKMVSFKEAIELITSSIPALPAQLVEVHRALGRVLAEDARAKVSLPELDISFLDGYALKSSSIKPTARLRVKARIFAGSFEELCIEENEAVWVATGAPIPEGADAVIGEEKVEEYNGEIELKETVSSGANIIKAKQEFTQGDLLLTKGTRLFSHQLALLVAGGYSEVRVFPAPRIWVIALGDELSLPARAKRAEQIYPSAGWLVAIRCEEMGAELERVLLVEDEPSALLEVFPEPQQADLVITVGGTGFGKKDIIAPALFQMGAEIIFQGVKIRPCHSLIFSRVDDLFIISLPGRIPAVDVGLELFIKPALLKLQGREPKLRAIKAKISQEIISPALQAQVIRARIETKDGELWAHPLREKSWHKELILADGLILIEPEQEQVSAGETVKFIPYDHRLDEIFTKAF